MNKNTANHAIPPKIRRETASITPPLGSVSRVFPLAKIKFQNNHCSGPPVLNGLKKKQSV